MLFGRLTLLSPRMSTYQRALNPSLFLILSSSKSQGISQDGSLSTYALLNHLASLGNEFFGHPSSVGTML